MSNLSATGALLVLIGLSAVGALLWPREPARPSAVYFFGDSLTDSGNLGCNRPGLRYSGRRCSNGPVWSEGFAASLGASAVASSADGTNFAVSGQRSDQVLALQIPELLARGSLDPEALYVIWIGANDFLRARSHDEATLGALADSTAGNIADSVSLLRRNGASQFLVLNLLDLGAMPAVARGGAATAATLFTDRLNEQIAARLAALASAGITQFDVRSHFDSILADPDSFGFRNATTPCTTDARCGADPHGSAADGFVFYDGIHPTQAAHKLIEVAAYQALARSAR